MESSWTLSSGNLAFGTTGMHAERCVESQSIIAFVPLECMYSACETGRGELIAVLVKRPPAKNSIGREGGSKYRYANRLLERLVNINYGQA